MRERLSLPEPRTASEAMSNVGVLTKKRIGFIECIAPPARKEGQSIRSPADVAR
jgi:hypothetical protein